MLCGEIFFVKGFFFVLNRNGVSLLPNESRFLLQYFNVEEVERNQWGKLSKGWRFLASGKDLFELERREFKQQDNWIILPTKALFVERTITFACYNNIQFFLIYSKHNK